MVKPAALTAKNLAMTIQYTLAERALVVSSIQRSAERDALNEPHQVITPGMKQRIVTQFYWSHSEFYGLEGSIPFVEA